MKPSLVVVAVAWCALSGCADVVVGDGVSESSLRATGPFRAIAAKTALDVEVTRGDVVSVVVTTDENVAPSISTDVVGDTLEITQAGDVSPSVPSVISIVVPALVAADANGAGAMSVQGFSSPTLHLGDGGSGPLTATVHADALDVDASGSGSITLDGETDTLALALAGSGSVDATQLPARGADVHVGGSGTASLVVSGDSSLDASGSGSIDAALDDGDTTLAASGSATIRWSGDAHVVSETRTGSGTIVHE